MENVEKSILKKRVLVIFVLICISYITYGVINMRKVPNQVAKVNALPITNKVVVIDAGHGLPDEGAVGFSGTTEQAINLSISLKLQKLIEQSGATVVLTRSDENGIYSLDSSSIREKKVSDTKNRVEIGNNSNADIFVSIHLNKYPPSEVYRGWQTFYQKNSEKSKKLADTIQNSLNENIEFENNRVSMPITGIYIMEHVEIPSIIVECGFLSNPEEANALKEDNYQNKLVWGIYTALQKYFQEENEEM